MLNPLEFKATSMPPTFDDALEHRAHIKAHLAAGFRLFARLGLNIGVAGHITARDPLWPDHFWVNSFGAPYASMRAEHLSLVRHDGRLVEGAAINAAAFAIHSEIHRARPDVVCAAHGHPLHGTAWSAMGRLLDPIGQDVCAFYEDHALFEEDTGLVLELSEGARIAQTLEGKKAVLLRNHGLLTVGRTVDEALWWFVLMERCCQMQMMTQALGQPHLIPPAQARAIAAHIGTAQFGWFQCQPLLQPLLRDEATGHCWS